MNDIVDFMKRTSEKIGFKREKYIDDNLPTSFENIVVVMFFGDMRSEFVMSSFILNRIKEFYKNKYFIVCSYSGRSGIYSYADEFWGFNSKQFMLSSSGFDNSSDIKDHLGKQLNKYFDTVITETEYYHNGFTKKFMDDFKNIKCFLPSIVSSKTQGNVFVYPSKIGRCWGKGEEVSVAIKYSFWIQLLESICKVGMKPVVYQDNATYDVSPVMESRCFYSTDNKISDVLGLMRSTGCVLDVFSGISSFAKIARTPYVSCDERNRHNNTGEFGLDVLMPLKNKHIFSLPTILEGDHWAIQNIVNNLELFVSNLKPEDYPSTSEESVNLSYELIKEKKRKKIGNKLLKSGD